MNIVDGVVIGSAWLLFMTFRQTRTIRTVLLLSVLTAVYIVGSAWPTAVRIATRVALVVVAGIVVLKFDWLIWSMSRPELDFDEELRRITSQVRTQVRRHVMLDFEDMRQLAGAFGQAQGDAERLRAPMADWEHLHALVLDYLRYNRELYAGVRPFDEEAAKTSTERWLEIRHEWDALRARRSHFFR